MESNAVFTIVTKSHLPFARVMAERIRRFHGDIPFYVFLSDRPDGYFELEREPFRGVTIDQVLPPNLLATMSGYYTAYELCNALKPFAHLYLHELGHVSRWFYLDSDVCLLASLAPMFDELADAAILLVPHILQPVPVANIGELELMFLRTGIYNGGCLGISRSDESRAFLEWWKERLVWHCLHGWPGIEADQSWLNFVIPLFGGWKMMRHPGVNVAYWNIHERPLEGTPERGLSVQGHPVLFLHFSGWDWRNPDLPTRHHQPQWGASREPWTNVARSYAADLKNAGADICQSWPYSFAKARNGCVITPAMRRNYWAYLRDRNGSARDSLFEQPEKFKSPRFQTESLWGPTRIWLGAVRRYFFPN